jgi:hypothetical protein
MDNETLKKSIMQQILQEANSANARTLMEVSGGEDAVCRRETGR